jgi:hypothetical protein
MARIYQAATMGEAHVRVALVAERGLADLLVHRVNSFGLAVGDGLWFITRDKQEATAWVFFTSIGMAEVKICFVDSYAEAGWQTVSRYKGRFAH